MLFDAMPHGALRTDRQGTVLMHNQRLLELLHVPATFFSRPRRVGELSEFGERRGDLATGHGNEALASSAEAWDFGASGNRIVTTSSGRHVEVRRQALPDRSAIYTCTDVTEQVQALQASRASERYLAEVIDSLPGLLVAINSKLEYTMINELGSEWIGKPKDRIVGRSIRENLSETRVAEIRAFMETASFGEQRTVESRYEATGTRPRSWLQVTQVMVAQPDGVDRTCYAFAVDITARKMAEEALVEAKLEAERANRAKSEFLRTISHELRTPMNAIVGFGELLAGNDAGALTEEQRRHVAEIRRGSSLLLSLINELLDMAQAEHGSLNVSLEAVRLVSALEDSVRLLGPLAQKVGVLLEAPVIAERAEHVQGDAKRLRQVFVNLISNAIKYNRPGGRVRISVTEHEGTVTTAVTDEGSGLDELQQARLFKPFERLVDRSSAIEGTGLGLALSQALTRAMGGEIRVESEPGRGTTFRVVLRAAEGAPAPSPQTLVERPVAAMPPGWSPKVLYVDDNPVNVMLVEAMLARLPPNERVEFRSELHALEGLRAAEQEPYDLVLLDIEMPSMNGFELLRKLREKAHYRDAAVVAVSAYNSKEEMESALAAGFSSYLAKPFEMQELHAVVRRVLVAG
ncbi:MAG: response regulator [Proteobacteria bacterium]|nr:response regulator [Pseudomonadota bacterium]